MDLVNTALSLVGVVKPDLAKQAKNEMSNYTQDSNGLRKLIIKYGGKAFVDQAYNHGKNSPKISALMKKFHIDPNELKNIAYSALDNKTQEQIQTPQASQTLFKNKLDQFR